MIKIHPTAIIAKTAELGDGVRVGPYAVIEDHVQIGAQSVIGPHVVIHSHTYIGAGNTVHAHAVLGDQPQHLAHDQTLITGLQIGDNNVIREMVTIHRATDPERMTRVGSQCLLMANTHIGHDCQVGDGVTITNNAGLSGHVELGDHVVLGGTSGVHQHVRVGAYAMIGALSLARKDVMPYCLLSGDPAKHYRLNSVALKRHGINGERYRALERVLRQLRSGAGVAAVLTIAPELLTPELMFWQQWLQQPSKRGIAGFASAK